MSLSVFQWFRHALRVKKKKTAGFCMKMEVLFTSSSLISLCLQSISSGCYFNPRGQRALTPFLNISKKDILSFCFSSCQARSFLITHSFRPSRTQRSISESRWLHTLQLSCHWLGTFQNCTRRWVISQQLLRSGVRGRSTTRIPRAI